MAASVTDEPRRARGAWALYDAAGLCTNKGEAEAIIDDAALSVGTVRVDFLDADALRAADHRIECDLWPSGKLVITGLGRRFDNFAAELRHARNKARVAGLLAHAPTAPDTFSGAVLSPDPAGAAELQVYPTHLTVIPNDADPWQLPFGSLDDVCLTDDPPAVTLVTDDRHVVIGQLGRLRDSFHASVKALRDAQAQTLARYTNRSGFADGIGMPRDRISGFDSLLGRCCSPERIEGARRILASANGGVPLLGFVQLLDPDAESQRAAAPLPENWASFLLVPVGHRVVLEILAGPCAATYVFEGTGDAVNADLQKLHFRRAGLAMSAEQAELVPDNPQRLALRRLAPLQRLRAATRARVVHDPRWAEALSDVLVPGGLAISC